MDFLVVLFKNKDRRKIINKFKTEKRALDFFKKELEKADKVIFRKETENGEVCEYEIGLLEKRNNNNEIIYKKDVIGRKIKVELDDDEYQIKRIETFNIEEVFLDYSTNKKIDTNQFIKKYLNKSGMKMISKLNNKVIVQNDEKINLFTFKSVYDSDRFLDCLQNKLFSDGKMDCLFVKDYTTVHRKYLYKLLTDYGFPIKYLQTYSTAFLSKK